MRVILGSELGDLVSGKRYNPCDICAMAHHDQVVRDGKDGVATSKVVNLSDRWKWALISVLVIAWAINLIIPIIVKEYKSPPEVHVAVMSIIGILAAQKTKSGDDPPNDRS